MDRSSFLLEIGCEEIPAGYIEPALAQLAADLLAWLREEGLDPGPAHRFATPRRLAVRVESLALGQADRDEEILGPPAAVAFKGEEPTPAALGFARGQGVDLADLHRVDTPKGEYLAVHKRIQGRDAASILAEGLGRRILGLRFPKTMIWGDGSLRFARPIRWLLALLGASPIPFTLGELVATRVSRGHRLLAPGPVEVARAEDYEETLAGVHVTVAPRVRRDAIAGQAHRAAAASGGRLVEDESLLDTVNYLVEQPAALTGRFDAAFLDLPREVITTAMKSHQRYFSVEDEAGRLLPVFIVILNGERPQPDLVRAGNERVLQARLADARFYWREDCRAGMAGLVKRLESVVWLEGYGTLAERGQRLVGLADRLAERGAPWLKVDREALRWAAAHAKADLASEMIKDGKEFTLLQGYMGQEYARAEGIEEGRTRPLREHALPRFAGDALPQSPPGILLALADRLDAVAGFWQAGFAPTGSKDPYGLRRMVLAILRILLEKELPLRLDELLDDALAGYGGVETESPREAILDFMRARLRGLLEEEGVPPDIFDAVWAGGETRPLDLRARVRALSALRGDPAFEKLVVGARRVRNILAKEGRKLGLAEAAETLRAWSGGDSQRFAYEESRLAESAEKDLHAALVEAAPLLWRAGETRDYDGAYRRLADLGTVIDRYFDGVLVNCEDPKLRANRLALLQNLAHIFLYFADFSLVVLEGERESGTD